MTEEERRATYLEQTGRKELTARQKRWLAKKARRAKA